MSKVIGLRWAVVAVSAVMLLVLAAACGETKTVEVPGETIVVEKIVTETVEVPGETIVVEKIVTETVEVPGETVVKEVVKEVVVPGETIVVEKEVVRTVEVPGETVVVTKEVVKTVAGPERVVEKEVIKVVPAGYVTDPATGMTWTAPQYGGTLTWAVRVFPPGIDPWWSLGWAQHIISGVNEKLSIPDWGLSREMHVDLYSIVTPEMARGALAESWSMPDDTTFIWNIRQGVNWDNKAPVNGREFDAYDVEWNYHRYLGLGDFTEDGPSAGKGGMGMGLEFESVTATDKWTVEIKLPRPQLNSLGKMANDYWIALPREVIESWGDAKDWRNVVGTGPLRLTDFVEGSSVTWEKNPNYWGYDEKFPENRLPYIDEYRSLLMPDPSTRLAALRTGKIDMLSNAGDSPLTNVDNVDSLQKTNPEIEVSRIYLWIDGAFGFNQSLPLMQDVNVRKALQMSVDRETISATFFKRYGVPAPYGLVSQGSKGWAWPYEDWPEDVKMGYMYDPAGAEALLDAAGYTRGADGYRFKVKIAHSDRYDPTYTELLMGYLEAIGVKSEMVVQTTAEQTALGRADTHEWHIYNMDYGVGAPSNYIYRITRFGDFDNAKAKDPRMDALVAAMQTATTMEEWQSLHRQADEITVREHWGLVKSNSPKFSATQPWVEGFFGELGMGWGGRNTLFARLWIDSELKEAMGR